MRKNIYTTFNLDISYFKVEELKTLMNKHQIDFERAVTVFPDGELDLTEELQNIEVEATGDYYGGFHGTYYEPPEDENVEISDIKKIKFADKEIDISEAFNDEAWGRITEILWEKKNSDDEDYLAGLEDQE